MVKEHLIETYGPVRYTIGAGSSGGSMQQHQLAAGYPGLLDGIQPMASFPDVWETVQEAEDCHLLNHYFDSTSPQLWAVPAQRDAVMGWLEDAGCRLMLDGPHKAGTPVVGSYAGMWLDPTNAAGCGLPTEQVYNPQTNRGGTRCTLPDYMASVFGRRAQDGFANTIYDNTGVQYGLQALQSGTITAEQFVDLNEKVGGLDVDWAYSAMRSVADRPALEAAYRGGLVSEGPALARVPIVDLRGTDNVEIHSSFHTYVMRARLDRTAGGHDNQVIWTGARPLLSDPTSFNRAFLMLDDWLARIEADDRPGTRAEKVRRDKPAEAVDTCWIEGRAVTDQAACDAAFPHFADPRIAAGPQTDDVLKCELKPLARRDFPVTFTADQWARLQRAFPGGVCDYAQRPVGHHQVDPWMSYP
jgi:uncharacterized tannase-like protein DUF6351